MTGRCAHRAIPMGVFLLQVGEKKPARTSDLCQLSAASLSRWWIAIELINRDRYCEACNWPFATRQDVKERESSDDNRSRSDDSYSPRRHWCPVLSPTVKRGSGVAYRRVMTFVGFRRRSRLGVCSVSAPRASDRRDRRSKWPRRAREDVTRCRYCTQMLPALMLGRASCR